jgi:hypothetical protein
MLSASEWLSQSRLITCPGPSGPTGPSGVSGPTGPSGVTGPVYGELSAASTNNTIQTATTSFTNLEYWGGSTSDYIYNPTYFTAVNTRTLRFLSAGTYAIDIAIHFTGTGQTLYADYIFNGIGTLGFYQSTMSVGNTGVICKSFINVVNVNDTIQVYTYSSSGNIDIIATNIRIIRLS